MKIQKTPYYSYKIGKLAKGCKLCVKGKKLVLFVTGLCSKRCYYCPISEEKYGKDVIYANERPVKNLTQIFEEIKLSDAEGAGITGGDPLVKINRTIKYIKALKEIDKFHIHLYTPLNLVNKANLRRLYNAGLDEIRFHPDLDNRSMWGKIKLAKSYDWDVGVEIPVIPGKIKKTKELIDFIYNIVDFLNMNELEYSDSNAFRLSGFKTKALSYAIKGSDELAKRLLKYISKNYNLNVHYCTVKLKDKVQLGNRLKLRATNIAKPYDIVTSEGTLIRGALYLPNLMPTFSYRKKLEKLSSKKMIIKKLKLIMNKLIKENNINKNLICVDKQKLRILISPKLLKDIKTELVKAIVEEYPTYDQLELEIDFVPN